MSEKHTKTTSNKAKTVPANTEQELFSEVVTFIEQARQQAYQAVNTELIHLYWQIGEYISKKITSAQWGDGIVDQLAKYIAHVMPGIRGFTRRNLFRMRQFYETYAEATKVSPLVSQLSWTHHLLIMSQCKCPEERGFYMLDTATDADEVAQRLEGPAAKNEAGGEKRTKKTAGQQKSTVTKKK